MSTVLATSSSLHEIRLGGVMTRGGFVPEAIPTQPARQPIALAPTKPVSPKVVATAPKAMLAQEVSKAPRQPWGDEKWIAEVKIDGMRVLLVQAENGPTFYSRSGIRYEYPFLADVLEMALRRAESEAKRWTEEAARLRLELAKERKR